MHLRSLRPALVVGVMVALVLVGCSSSGSQPASSANSDVATRSAAPAPLATTALPSPTATSPSGPTATPMTPESTPIAPPGSTPLGSALDSAGPGPLGSQVLLPDDPVGAPVAVIVHGGAWVAGTPDSMAPLARALADRGFVTVSVSYATVALGGREPQLTDDVACGIRHARAVAAEVGATGPLVLVGHSAGAHLATVVGLSPEGRATDCPWPGDATPDRLVSLAGVFSIDAVEVVMRVLLGGTRDRRPDAWDAFDPHVLAATSAAGVGAFPVHLLVGARDRLAPPVESRRFAATLEAVGVDVEVVELPGVDHFTILASDVADDIAAVLD